MVAFSSWPASSTTMNKTLLLALLTRCREVLLEDLENDHQGTNGTATTVTPTQTTLIKSGRQSYDNAYFYILFVMFFYSFLALTLFRSFVHSDKTKKDPYEEFMGSTDVTAQKYGEGSVPEKFDFEEENII